MKVLLAASSQTMKKLIMKSLQERNDEVFVAESEEQILNIIHNNKPTIILLQGTLWSISGFEISLSIKSITQIPTIIFSSAEDIQEKFIKYASSDFLEVPFSKETLYDKIDCLVQNKKTILIVDDSEIIRKTISNSLKGKGFDTITAVDGKDGLEKLNNEHIDVILSDIEMPNMNGYEFCRNIKMNENTSYIPVILTSTLSSGLFIDRGFQAGADEYIAKPVNIENLIVTINNMFSHIDNVERGNILIIDEAEYLFHQIKSPLINQGFLVFNVSKVSEAISTISKKNINILIIHDTMIDILGLSIVKKLKSRNIIVIILMNRNSRKKIATYKAAKIEYYLAKPFTTEKVVGIVERAVTNEYRNRELEAIKSYISEAALATARQIAKNKIKKDELRAEERILTILFCDIKGFSTLCENLESIEIVKLLNDIFDLITDVLKKHGGLIDKYIGDAIMALFDPLKDEEAHHNAVLASLEMQQAISNFNKNRQDNPVNIRIGINTGSVIWGDVGSHLDRRDTTVIGDPVNLASRLEGVNKIFGTNIIISNNTYNYIKDRIEVRELDIIRVKGKIKPTKIYEVLDKKGNLNNNKKNSINYYNQGVSLYRNREFKESIKYFLKVIDILGNDYPSKTYIKRAKSYIKNPPPENWDGVFTMITK